MRHVVAALMAVLSIGPAPALADNLAPVAAFAFAPTHSPQEQQFTASQSRDPDGVVVGYVWDFGDGTTGSGATLVHRFPAPGTYTVALRATDGKGASSTVEQSVTVVLASPTAVLSAGESRCAGQRFGLTVAAADSDGHIRDIRWDLDGKAGYELDTLTAPATAVTFAPGKHHVAVRVTDDSGLTAEAGADFTFTACNLSIHAPARVRTSDRTVHVRVTCPDACAIDAQVLAGARSLGRGIAALAGAGTQDVTIVLGAGAKRALRAQGRVNVVARVVATSGAITT